MKSTFIAVFGLLVTFVFFNVIAQTNAVKRSMFPFFPFCLLEDTNVIIEVADPTGNGKPCPPQYTNAISNPNLFSPREQELLSSLSSKYQNVTSNRGPSGSVFAGRYQTNIVITVGHETFTNSAWISRFRYPSSGAQEELAFSSGAVSARYRAKDGHGYSVGISSVAIGLDELSGGKNCGLSVTISHPQDEITGGVISPPYHLSELYHYTNGMLTGKLLIWNPRGLLVWEADFQKPYDLSKHQMYHFGR
jgi:hypothetical protein